MKKTTILIIAATGLAVGLVATLIGWPFFMLLPLLIPMCIRKKAP